MVALVLQEYSYKHSLLWLQGQRIMLACLYLGAQPIGRKVLEITPQIDKIVIMRRFRVAALADAMDHLRIAQIAQVDYLA